MKECRDCKLILPEDNFYLGARRCKGCHGIVTGRWKKINKLKTRATCNATRARHPEISIESRRRAQKNWKLNNPLKIKAQTIAYNAIRDKKLRKQPCCLCGEQRVVAHHSDYSQPLQVTWLCPKHHRAWHNVFVAEL